MPSKRPAVFLHVGPMKSGTSYLQQLMADNQDHLAGAGILYPGSPPRKVQARGVQQILKAAAPGGDDEPTDDWQRLRDDISAHDGSACVLSMEFLSFARSRQAAAIVESLRPAEVHVILTLRDASRVLPSAWATSTRNRETTPWPKFAEAAARGPGADKALWRRSMRALNVPRMLRVWGGVVPAERLHVVPVPPPGSPPDLLWQRFAAVIGVEPDICSSPRARRNESFGYASAELMRRVNAHVNHLPKPEYSAVSRKLCMEILDLRLGEPKIPMTPELMDFAARWNGVVTAKVLDSGARVHGSLDDLTAAPALTQDTIEPVPKAALLAAAHDAAAGLTAMLASDSGDGTALPVTVGDPDPDPDTDTDIDIDIDIDTAVQAVSSLYEAVARSTRSDRG